MEYGELKGFVGWRGVEDWLILSVRMRDICMGVISV